MATLTTNANRLAQINRRRDLAAALQQSAINPGPLVHPLQGYAKLAQALAANAINKRASKDEEALADERRKAIADALDPTKLQFPGANTVTVKGPMDLQRAAEIEQQVGTPMDAEAAAIKQQMLDQARGPSRSFQLEQIEEVRKTPTEQLQALSQFDPDLASGIAGQVTLTRMLADQGLIPGLNKSPNVDTQFGVLTTDIAGVGKKGDEIRFTESVDQQGNLKTFAVTEQGAVNIPQNALMSATQRTSVSESLTPGAQAKLANELVDLNGLMRKTNDLQQKDPTQYLSVRAKFLRTVGNTFDKWIELSDTQKAWLYDQQKFRGSVEQIFQGIRREVTGAQAAQIELEVLQEVFLSNKMSPAQFSAALQLINEMTFYTIQAKRQLLAQGFDALDTESFNRAVGRMVDAQIRPGIAKEIIGQGGNDELDSILNDPELTQYFNANN